MAEALDAAIRTQREIAVECEIRLAHAEQQTQFWSERFHEAKTNLLRLEARHEEE